MKFQIFLFKTLFSGTKPGEKRTNPILELKLTFEL